MRKPAEELNRSIRGSSPSAGSARGWGGVTLVIAAIAFVVSLATTSADAQRAVIVVDGERVELDFDEFRQVRNEIEELMHRDAQNGQFRRIVGDAEVDVSLPDDRELGRVTIDAELLSLVAELNSECYTARESATKKLLDVPHDNVQFYAVLVQHELTVEQYNRLLMIVRQRLLHAPRGAVGITMGQQMIAGNEHIHIVVEAVHEGLPAARVLQRGDLITHLNGERLRSREQLTMTVQSHRPGEQITLTVLRPKDHDRGRLARPNDPDAFEELTIELTLGSADLLPSVNGRRFNQFSPVDHVRQMKAREFMDRFPPRQTVIEYDRELISMRAEDMSSRHVERMVERRIEEHPAIRQLLDQQRAFAAQNHPIPEVVRAQWLDTRERLKMQLGYANLSAQQRAVLKGVIERFSELIEE